MDLTTFTVKRALIKRKNGRVRHMSLVICKLVFTCLRPVMAHGWIRLQKKQKMLFFAYVPGQAFENKGQEKLRTGNETEICGFLSRRQRDKLLIINFLTIIIRTAKRNGETGKLLKADGRMAGGRRPVRTTMNVARGSKLPHSMSVSGTAEQYWLARFDSMWISERSCPYCASPVRMPVRHSISGGK